MEIRLARPDEAAALTELIWLSDSGILAQFTQNDPAVIEKMIRDSADCPTLLFSYDNIIVAERNGLVAGLCFGYDTYSSKLSIRPTAISLWKALGFWKFLGLLPAWVRLASKTSFEDSDFYLSNIAVYPEYRRLGIGCYLLEYAEIYCGRKRVVLDVADENYEAQKFYAHHGYDVEKEWQFLGKKYLRLAKLVNTEIKL